MFSSSIANDTDLKRLEETLNCDIKMIPTFHVEKHPSAKHPEAYLQNMVSEHLAGKSCYNFVIIATGSNDITCLDTVNESPVSLYEQVKSHTGVLCDTCTDYCTGYWCGCVYSGKSTSL